MHLRGCISIHGVGCTIFDNVILICGAMGGRFVGCQISIAGICSHKLRYMKKLSSGRFEFDFASPRVTARCCRGRAGADTGAHAR